MKASLFAATAATLICSSSLGAEPPKNWGVDAAGCKFASANPVDSIRPYFKFSGICVNGFVAGSGEVTILDGSNARYRGEFREGQLVKGVLDEGSLVYEGDLVDNRSHGQGTVSFSDGRVFKGRFEKGWAAGNTGELTVPGRYRYAGAMDTRSFQPLGTGIMYYEDGAVLVGEFKQGKVVGVLKDVDGTVSQGTFMGGVLQGQGKIEWLSGARYEGEIRGSQPSGQGHMERPTGEVYDGSFADGYYHGKGTLKTGRGEVYVGDFVLGKFHGNGEVKFVNGDVQSGEWREGLLHGKCRIVTATETYDGNCSAGTRTGLAHWESPETRQTYDGKFSDGLFDGKGKLRHMTSEGVELTYEGEFSRGTMQGAGVMTLGELKFDCTFKDGEFQGGRVTGPNGRTFEVDAKTGAVVEVLKDGSKRALDALPDDVTI